MRTFWARRIVGALALGTLLSLTGCAKIKARDFIREGNQLYRDGRYIEAIEKYDAAEELEPDGVTLYWNRACAAESQILKMKDPEQRQERKTYADMALRDFQKWYDRLPEKADHDAKELETHRLAIFAADERCDDLLSYWLERHRAEPKEEGLYKRIARQYADCGDEAKKLEWYVKRTQHFPDSPKSWHELAILEFEPLFPPADSPVPYNENLSQQQRLERADKVIALLDKATAIDSKFRDAYVWRAMAHAQKQLARRVIENPTEWGDKLEAIRAREDNMNSWRQQKAVCDLDEIPDCPTDPKAKIEGACCPPPPVTPTDQAADEELKRTIEAEMKAAADAEAAAEAEKGQKQGKKNKKGKRGK